MYIADWLNLTFIPRLHRHQVRWWSTWRWIRSLVGELRRPGPFSRSFFGWFRAFQGRRIFSCFLCFAWSFPSWHSHGIRKEWWKRQQQEQLEEGRKPTQLNRRSTVVVSMMGTSKTILIQSMKELPQKTYLSTADSSDGQDNKKEKLLEHGDAVLRLEINQICIGEEHERGWELPCWGGLELFWWVWVLDKQRCISHHRSRGYWRHDEAWEETGVSRQVLAFRA